MGADYVVLSLGSRGAVGAADSLLVESVPPLVDAVCPIGAGDALAAAFVWATASGKPFADAVRWGVAAGTASATLPGISFANLAQAEQIHSRVELRVLSV
jgi:fructose-1-phosphate kinase PfkB-like protein